MRMYLFAGVLFFTSHWVFATGASASEVAPGVDCRRDPIRGDVCGLYYVAVGSASAEAAGQSFSVTPGGTGYTYGPSVEYQGRADSGNSLTSASSAASFYATFGMLRARSSASAGTGGELFGFNAGASALSTVRFDDTLNVFSASRSGQSGTVIATLDVNGQLDASTLGQLSRAAADVSVAVRGDVYSRALRSESEAASGSGVVPARITFSIPIVFSPDFFQPFSVSLSTSASASSVNFPDDPRAAVSLSDYGSTLTWGGVLSVLDASGEAVTDWGMRSGSGFDYSRSFVSQVPEPSSYALLVAGGLLLIAHARRRALRKV